MKKTIVCFIFLFMVSPIFAETIVLKSGRTIEAEILERTDDYIKVYFNGISLTYFPEQIESIDGKQFQAAGNKDAGKNPDAAKESSVKENTAADSSSQAGVNKKDILEKIKIAQKDLKRYQEKFTSEIEIKNFMYFKTEGVSDIDLESKIMHSQSGIKECKINFEDSLKSRLESEILKAKKEGAAQEKIQQIQDRADKTLPAMKKVMDQLAEKMKEAKPESFITDKAQYMRSKDKWLKIGFFKVDAFWQAVEKSREGSVDKEALQQILADLPGNEKESFSALFSRMGSREYQGMYDIKSIQESNFQGTPCYVLDINANDSADFMKEAVSLYKKSKNEDVQASLDSFSYKEFISKDSYLKLGSQVNLKMSMQSAKHPELSLKAEIKSDMAYDYPKDKISLPKELSDAVSVKDKEELNKILMEDYKDMLEGMIPEGSVCPLVNQTMESKS